VRGTAAFDGLTKGTFAPHHRREETGGAVVNIDGSDNSYWNTAGNLGDTDQLVILLLHELGHVYDDLIGSGGSQIKNDNTLAGGLVVLIVTRLVA